MSVGVTTAQPVICRLTQAAIAEVVAIQEEVGDTGWSESAFVAEFSSATSAIWGARLGGGLIGFLVVQEVLDEAHVLNVAVSAAHQGQGVGRALLGYVLHDLFQRGRRTVFLEVRPSNVRARSLYESVGFSEVGRRQQYYRDNAEDAVVLRLDLLAYIERSRTPHRSAA